MENDKPLPRLPWVASSQYGMHFILSQDNEILWNCDFVPFEVLEAMVDAANKKFEEAPNDRNREG